MSRINYYTVAKEGIHEMIAMENYLKTTDIDPILGDLVRLRASLINGCAYCVKLHSTDLQKQGVNFERIMGVSVWKDSDFYTEKEKAAFELTEYVTKISEKGVPEEVYQRVRQHFSEKEYVDLVLSINSINTWNRLSISMGNQATSSKK